MNQQVSDPQLQDDTDGIGLGEIIEFLSDNWKRAVVGAIAGAVIGAGGWATFSDYKAEAVMVNSIISKQDSKQDQRAINFISWRVLQKNLPILASQLRDSNGGDASWSALENSSWWQKNVVPTYSLSKADTKDLAAISKDLQDNEGQTILSLTVTTKGGTKEKALARLEETTRFIRDGSAYLLIKNLVNSYEAQILNNDAELQKKITDAEIELTFLRGRAENLEALRQRFPQNVAVGSQQIVDLKDSSAKFMPISTQLVAVNTDINNTVETLKRLRDRQAQMRVLQDFITMSQPLMSAETNGLKLAGALLGVEASIRQQVGAGDVITQQQLNDIRAEVVSIQTRFTKGLESGAAPYISRSSPLAPLAGGCFGGALLVLLYAIARKMLDGLKARATSA